MIQGGDLEQYGVLRKEDEVIWKPQQRRVGWAIYLYQPTYQLVLGQ